MTTDTAIVRPDHGDPVRALSRFLDARVKNLAKFAASRIRPEVLVRLAVFEFSQNEWLRRCTPESIYASLILAAQMGLEPSGLRGECYLVPYKGKCTLIPGWRGLVKLALRSKAVKSVYSHIVYEADEFRVWLGSEPRVEHRPSFDGQRGNVIAAYAVALMENGAIDIEVMTIEELEKVRDMARAGRGGKDGPAYENWEEQMYRKAPIRRLAKRLPLGDDFFLAAKADELADAGEPDKITSYIDAEVVEETKTAANDSLGVRIAQRASAVESQ
jgi:recombination protein RecT